MYKESADEHQLSLKKKKKNRYRDIEKGSSSKLAKRRSRKQ